METDVVISSETEELSTKAEVGGRSDVGVDKVNVALTNDSEECIYRDGFYVLANKEKEIAGVDTNMSLPINEDYEVLFKA